MRSNFELQRLSTKKFWKTLLKALNHRLLTGLSMAFDCQHSSRTESLSLKHFKPVKLEAVEAVQLK